MRANIDNIRETDRNAKRDNGFHREIAVIDRDGKPVVIARIYQPGTVAYCSLWISGAGSYGRGQGKAGGGGYHKPSAALQAAIDDAGITLTNGARGRDKAKCNIGGVGDSAMTEACEAIARALTGKRRFIVHVAHG